MSSHASARERAGVLGGPASVIETACPLDCPDACSLAVTVQRGRVIEIDGSHKNPVTDGYICAKVRKFGEHVYGDDRLLYPAVRTGPKGQGAFKRVTWDEALDLIVDRFRRAQATHGAASILPFSYGGSNGLLTQDNLDAQLWRRLGTSRLARTVCAAPTGAANQALYGKMPSVTYQDYPGASLIVLWGVNPSATGIHLVHYVREARKRGATLVVVDLNTAIPTNGALTLVDGRNINDRGEISGRGLPSGCDDLDACGHDFLLIPCANPASCDNAILEQVIHSSPRKNNRTLADHMLAAHSMGAWRKKYSGLIRRVQIPPFKR